MSDEQVKEIKYQLCTNCGDRCCCRGMESCKDAMELITKEVNVNGTCEI